MSQSFAHYASFQRFVGIRFACHACGKPLNIKQELAGKRGVCPDCQVRFRIPLADSPTSEPLESDSGSVNVSPVPAGQASPDATGMATHRTVENQDAITAPVEGKSIASSVGETNANSAASAEVTAATTPESVSWYVRPPSGGQFGPASEEVLHQWLMEGRIVGESLLWRPGWEQWRAAHEVLPGLKASASPVSLTSNSGDNLAAAAESASPSMAVASANQKDPAQPKKAKKNVKPADKTSLMGSNDLGSSRRRDQRKARNLVTTVLLLVALALVGAIGWILSR